MSEQTKACEHPTGRVVSLRGLTVTYRCDECGETVEGTPGPDWRNWKGGILYTDEAKQFEVDGFFAPASDHGRDG